MCKSRNPKGKSHVLNEVLHDPKLKCRLMSLNTLTLVGSDSTITKDECVVSDGDFSIHIPIGNGPCVWSESGEPLDGGAYPLCLPEFYWNSDETSGIPGGFHIRPSRWLPLLPLQSRDTICAFKNPRTRFVVSDLYCTWRTDITPEWNYSGCAAVLGSYPDYLFTRIVRPIPP
jgi:hypothetical protein